MASQKKTPTKAVASKKPKEPMSAPAGISKKKKKGTPKEWNFSHTLPGQDELRKNGRHEGRNLITWTRPRMAEKLLLHIQYECNRYKIELPWDSIAHRLHPGSSGGAVQQHMNRLRTTLVAEGHLVPPICQKPGSRVFVDQTIRGYVRKYMENSEDTVTTRPVKFDEPLDDRKFNLPDAYDNVNVPHSLKVEQMALVPAPGSTTKKGSKGGGRAAVAKLTPDPADLDSDDDYDPSAKVPASGARRSTRAKPATFTYCIEGEDSDECDDSADDDNNSGTTDNGTLAGLGDGFGGLGMRIQPSIEQDDGIEEFNVDVMGRAMYHGEIKGEAEKYAASTDPSQFDGSAGFTDSTSDLGNVSSQFSSGIVAPFSSPVDSVMSGALEMAASMAMISPTATSPVMTSGLPVTGYEMNNPMAIRNHQMSAMAASNMAHNGGAMAWHPIQVGDGRGLWNDGYPGVADFEPERPQQFQPEPERVYNFEKEIEAANAEEF